MKIVYSTESVTRNGGIQTVTIVKANALAEIPGNDVYIVVPHINGTSPRKISPKVHLINLGIKDYWVSVLKQPARNRNYKRLLQKELERIGPDIVVSTGLQDRNFLPRIKVSSNPVFIREIHFMSNYRRLMTDSFKENILALWSEFLDYRLSIKHYDRIVLLSEEDRKRNWPDNPKAIYMPNPLTGTSDARSPLKARKAIAVGRLCYQKHFDALIKAWKIISDKYSEWVLDIWGGNGPLYDSLKKLIVDLDLENRVYLKGETPDISAKMAESSMIISTSVFEGMPLVLLEALSAGLPIVTFNYKYGADEIVTDGVNGFIVEQDDLDSLANRIERLITDEKLRLEMGENAFEFSNRFLPETIADRWMNLFRKLRQEKLYPGVLR
ncbi:MAG: glycosyltransferase family 4 protein [Bacteroidales bacterium]|nr:glycosyltransferase family 4 protein [Bacteroidales bacterium]